MKKTIIFLIFTVLFCGHGQADQLLMFNSLHKPPDNLLMKTDSSFTFYCLVNQQIVHWRKADVFNPAAIVKGDLQQKWAFRWSCL